MIAPRLKTFLDRNGVKYMTIAHSRAYTAREIAEAAHVQGKDFAKTVIVSIDNRMAMAVLPASEKLDIARLRQAAGARHIRLALESELDRLFPGCEPGAMPPFGNLYGLEVFAAKSLADDDQIAFNAGSHAEALRLAYRDFERLVRPRLASFSAPPIAAGRSRRPAGTGSKRSRAKKISAPNGARLTPALARCIRAIADTATGGDALTLGGVRRELEKADVTVSADGELLFPQDRTALVIEIDDLIDRYGLRTKASQFIVRNE